MSTELGMLREWLQKRYDEALESARWGGAKGLCYTRTHFGGKAEAYKRVIEEVDRGIAEQEARPK